MGKWQPPYPARQIVTPTRCQLGQRYRNLDRLRDVTCGPLASLTVKLHAVRCSWCQGGYHLVTTDELSVHRKVLTEVTR